MSRVEGRGSRGEGVEGVEGVFEIPLYMRLLEHAHLFRQGRGVYSVRITLYKKAGGIFLEGRSRFREARV